MHLVQNMALLALRPLIDKVLSVKLLSEGVSSAVSVIADHLTDHSRRLTRALEQANERAWKALEIALAGESLWNRLDRAEDRAFRSELRAFLDASWLGNPTGEGADLRRKCLEELRAARAAGLLTRPLDALDLNRQLGDLARFDSQKMLAAERQRVECAAAELVRHGHARLARLLRLHPPDGLPLLVLAVRYYFRRAVEADEQLHRGLAWVQWEQLTHSQDQAFDRLDRILAEHSDRLEEGLSNLSTALANTHSAALNILEELRQQGEQTARLYQVVIRLEQRYNLLERALCGRDGLVIVNEFERRSVTDLLTQFEALPDEQQIHSPALLNGLGKLQYAAGDFVGARRTFLRVAGIVEDSGGKAEATHNAYLAAVEMGQWFEALRDLQAEGSRTAATATRASQSPTPGPRPSYPAVAAAVPTVLGGTPGRVSQTTFIPLEGIPKLVVIRGLNLDREYLLHDGVNVVGRGGENRVDVDLEGQEPAQGWRVSRQHAVIVFREGTIVIEDLNSANGTFVNHHRLFPGERCPLGLDDVIKVGTVKLMVRM